MKMKNILSIVLSISLGLFLTSTLITSPTNAALTTSTVVQATNPFDNPYCNHALPPCPDYLPPCPEETHVNEVCQVQCCGVYLSTIYFLYLNACIDFDAFLYTYTIECVQEFQDYNNCIANGGTPSICQQILINANNASFRKFRAATRALAMKVTQGEQDALDNYINCLLGCNCDPDPVNSIAK